MKNKTKRKFNNNLCYIRRMARILYAIEYLGRYCRCGFDGFDEPWFMDFHHKKGVEKLYEVKQKISNASFSKYKEEIDKCEIVCSRCHRASHSNKEKYSLYKQEILQKLETVRELQGKITNRYFLTEEDKKAIKEKIESGLTMEEAASCLNLKYHLIKSVVIAQGIKYKRGGRTKLPKYEIVRLLNCKYTIRGIAKKLNLNRETVRRFIKFNLNKTKLENGVILYSLTNKAKTKWI